MFAILLLAVLTVVAGKQQLDPVADYLTIFKNKVKSPVGTLTTSGGAPIEAKETESLNTVLFNNEYFVDSMSSLVRETIPARIVHPKGAGAFGYFEATHDVSHICKADFLKKKNKTPVFCRFSTTRTPAGGSDLDRDTRGFACKFYTEEGNFDFVGFNTPIFGIKDPAFFAPLIHSTKKNPGTGLNDVNMIWDFLIRSPENLFIFLMIFGDLGVTDGFRHMSGHSVHTYSLYNATGSINHCRIHFEPSGGVKTLNTTEAVKRASGNLDYSTKDLFGAIANGNYPSWTVSLQCLTPKDVKNADFDVFDITRVLPENKYPLRPVGKMVLNKNPLNYFAAVEQAAFCPGNLVPGILGAPDKVFESRRFFYRDAQRYRLGENFDKILVNCPYRSKVLTYLRNGVPPVGNNGYDLPIYYPNSFNGPEPYIDNNRPSLPKIYEKKANNFDQAADYYANQITSGERSRLVENIFENLCPATKFLQDRAVQAFRKIHPDLGNRVAKALKEKTCIR